MAGKAPENGDRFVTNKQLYEELTVIRSLITKLQIIVGIQAGIGAYIALGGKLPTPSVTETAQALIVAVQSSVYS